MTNTNSSYNERLERFEDLKNQIKQYVSIVDVVSMSGVSLTKKGKYYEGPCPWHSEKSIGAFKVDDLRGRCRCFGCGDKWMDAIEYTREIYGLGYSETIEKLASDFGLISTLGRDYESKINRKKIDLPKPKKAVRHTDNMLHLIHSTFLESCSLSEEHLEYLKKERHLTDGDIFVGGFKTFPTRQIMMKNPPEGIKSFVEAMKEKNLKSKDLIGSPLFYTEILNDPNKKYKTTFKRMKGLILPICNAKREVVGLQIRRESGELRYLWVSSGSFADGIENPNLINGTDSGAPMDVVYPNQVRRNVLFITEGKFKAIAIAKQFGVPTISVQGVANWNGINETIKDIENELSIKFERICIAFDSDMAIKPQVLHHLLCMTQEIRKEFVGLISCLIWDINIGKGIDDYFENKGKTKDIMFKNIEEVEEYVDIILNDEKIVLKHQNGNRKDQALSLINVDPVMFSRKFFKLVWRNKYMF